MNKKFIASLALATAFAGALVVAVTTEASHSWGGYHWARTANPLALNVGDNVSSAWDAYLTSALSDWNASPVLLLTKTAGLTSPRTCKPTLGRIEVCNAKYGNNGWLGIAQIWISGSHITQGIAKMNDSYFNKPQYNTPAWRRLVMCQEIAHDFGLDHQNENFKNANLGSCMDYTNDPDGGPGGASATDPSNEHPNAHDFDQLALIYTHLDSAAVSSPTKNSNGAGKNASDTDFSSPEEWGQAMRADAKGRASLFERNLGNGKKVITHVIWIDEVEGR
ncbi:MAG TPA: hypothetical protein VJH94_04965 [Candidatus Paceibacterota bacterium]